MRATADRLRRFPLVLALFLAGPVIWFGHFMAVYLVAEAGCQAGGVDGFVASVTVGTTVLAVAATMAVAVVCLKRSRAGGRSGDASLTVDDPDRNQVLEFAGFLLAALFAIGVLFTGLPAIWLDPC